MHVENELVEFVTAGDQEYEEIVEEYEEEILVPEEIPEPSLTDFTNTSPAQGKPRCITLILQIVIYINVVHLSYRNFMIPTCIYLYLPMSLTSTGSCSCFA
jgi:uncharacterized membrane protein